MFPGKNIPSIIMVLLLLSSVFMVVATESHDAEPLSSTPTRTIVEESESNDAWTSADLLPNTHGNYELHGNLTQGDNDLFYIVLNGGNGPLVDRLEISYLYLDTNYFYDYVFVLIYAFYPNNNLNHGTNDEIVLNLKAYQEDPWFPQICTADASYSGIYGVRILAQNGTGSSVSGTVSYNFTVTISSVPPMDPSNDEALPTPMTGGLIGGLDQDRDLMDWYEINAPNPIHPTVVDMMLSFSNPTPNTSGGTIDYGIEVDLYISYNSRSNPGQYTNEIKRISPNPTFQSAGLEAEPYHLYLRKNCTRMVIGMVIQTFGINGITPNINQKTYSDIQGSTSYSFTGSIYPDIPNNRPILKNPTVNLERGRSTDIFEFRVEYVDANNETPRQIWVWNDEEPFRELSPISGSGSDHAAGVIYGVDVPGSILGKDAVHTLNFSAFDGKDWAFHSLDALETFTVIIDDNLPPSSAVGEVYLVELEEDSPTYEIDLDPLFTDPDPTTKFEFSILAPNGEWIQSYRDDNITAFIKPPQTSGEPNLLIVTPKANKFGTFVLTINATDDGTFRKFAELDIWLQVREVNDPPVIKRIGTRSVDEQDVLIRFQKEQDEKVVLSMVAEDIDEWDILSFDWNIEEVLSDPVPGVNFLINHTSGEMWFIPGDDDIPEVELMVWVEDGNDGEAEMSVIVEVSNVNDPPTIIVPASKSTIEDEYLYINPVATDPDIDNGDQLMFGFELGALSLAAPPNAIDFNPQTGRLILKAITEEMNGEWEINITVSDLSLLSDWGVCKVTIQNVNDVPQIENVYFDATDGNLTVFFNTPEGDDEDGDDLTYIWDFGDGTPLVQGIDMNRVEHTYVDGGSYTATLRIFDGKAYSDEVTVLLSVVAPEPDPDQDGDEMDDAWERRYGLDPTDRSDADLDPDNDGLTNLEEFRYCMEHRCNLNPINPDTDEDGWTDGKEISMSFDPMDPGNHPDSKYSGIPIMMYIGVILVMFLAVMFIFVFLVMKKRNKPKAVASVTPMLPGMEFPVLPPQAEMGYQEIPPGGYEGLPPAEMEYTDPGTGQYSDQEAYVDQGAYEQQVTDPYSQDVQMQYSPQGTDPHPADQEQWQQPPSPPDTDQVSPMGEPDKATFDDQQPQEILSDVNGVSPELVPPGPSEQQPEAGPTDPGTIPATDIGSPQESRGLTKLPPPPDIPDL